MIFKEQLNTYCTAEWVLRQMLLPGAVARDLYPELDEDSSYARFSKITVMYDLKMPKTFETLMIKNTIQNKRMLISLKEHLDLFISHYQSQASIALRLSVNENRKRGFFCTMLPSKELGVPPDTLRIQIFLKPYFWYDVYYLRILARNMAHSLLEWKKFLARINGLKYMDSDNIEIVNLD